MRENGAGPNGTESPGGESERIKRPTFHYLAEDDGEEQAWGLNQSIQRNAGGAQWT